ncbi:MAG: hypothetical protein WD851_12140, partial [Pirellulales bacterium]
MSVVDSDQWKTWAHQRLSTPIGQPGAMTLYSALPQEHLTFAHHLTAEKKVEEFVPGTGQSNVNSRKSLRLASRMR